MGRKLYEPEKWWAGVRSKPSGLVRLGDIYGQCRHPEHNPPCHIYLNDGNYQYTCPSCGHIQTFTVQGATL